MRNFDHTVAVLVKAYLNDELEHGQCDACAVGNIVSDAMGRSITLNAYAPYTDNSGDALAPGLGWPAVFCTVAKNEQFISEKEYTGVAKEQIDATGYSWQELARIELAFEKHNRAYTKNGNDDEAMFNGLMAVVDVLADIHGIDLKEKEEAKALFVRHSPVTGGV